MADINWCKSQMKGIRIIDPNENLASSYMKEADNNLSVIENIKGKWKVIIAYYTCYNALYSILMLAGIKCEIHDCTIAVMELIDEFSSDDVMFIKSMKKDRIAAQYYLKPIDLEDTSKVKDFVLKCKLVMKEIDADSVRKKIGDKN